ncbi:DUF2878 domain-containing protein [Pseudomonas sp. CDFA 602]|uniref:DUF2878 domain-containing protein n=1 Tax=Pseudomonas californiensis TaxID=2829823 RepID=UPI001E5A7972|nr:DUF2878 domain-containing protein [Pseudomonas californiensis]MCD5997209.1 DUF2878 domain-containing protein [Pseudomonas californiensis]MCD6002811.1 DUF2878 domain-containing protein [Pseudomonas californiensis]
MLKTLANALLFQAGWFACVLGSNSYWQLIAVVLLLIHFLWISSWAAEGRLVLLVTLAGIVLDSLLMRLGVFDFGTSGYLIPLWLVLLWALLGTTLNHCLAWTAKPLWRAALLGAISGPMSYYAGSQLAQVSLPLGLWPSMTILSLVWAITFPLLQWLATRRALPAANTSGEPF